MKIYKIEDFGGNTIASFEVDQKGEVINMQNCSYADQENNTIRVQLEVVTDTWCFEDIKNQSSNTEDGEEITDAQVFDVMTAVQRNIDASVGINWDVIDYWINKVKE